MCDEKKYFQSFFKQNLKKHELRKSFQKNKHLKVFQEIN